MKVGILWFIGSILFIWVALSIWVQMPGKGFSMNYGKSNSSPCGLALIVYDADPLYNLDQQLCQKAGEVLAILNWKVHLRTISNTKEIQLAEYDLVIVCSNTYNWAPDMAIKRFIRHKDWTNTEVMAVTLGSGSTTRAQKILENTLTRKGAVILRSFSLWLFKPNDESADQNKTNVDLALQKMELRIRQIIETLGYSRDCA